MTRRRGKSCFSRHHHCQHSHSVVSYPQRRSFVPRSSLFLSFKLALSLSSESEYSASLFCLFIPPHPPSAVGYISIGLHCRTAFAPPRSLRCIALLTQFPCCHSPSSVRPSVRPSDRRPQLSTAIRAPLPHRAPLQSAAAIL